MAVYKRTYKAYSGPLTASSSRFLVLTRYGLSRLFDSRLFTSYTVLCFLPFLAGLVFIYFVHSATAQMVLGVRFGSTPLIDNNFFMRFLSIEAWLGFLLTAWSAPGMIAGDFGNHGIQLYLSRPLSRAEYLAGKISILVVLLSCTTWIPALVLFGVQAQLQGHGWGWENLWMAGSIMVACLLWIALISLLSMALSVWVRWRIAATALMIASFFFLPAFGEIVDAIVRTHWGRLLNLPFTIVMVWSRLFRLSERQLHRGGFDVIPLWSAWASLLAVCAFCLWLLHLRLKAREVERT